MDKKRLSVLWDRLVDHFTDRFSADERIDVDGILFLIGVQELGQLGRKFKKDEKIDLLHIAICRLLMPFGYYTFKGIDDQGWPHYESTDKLPTLKPGEQTILIKQAIVEYALENEWLKENG